MFKSFFLKNIRDERRRIAIGKNNEWRCKQFGRREKTTGSDENRINSRTRGDRVRNESINKQAKKKTQVGCGSVI